jgi:hypothetical protein
MSDSYDGMMREPPRCIVVVTARSEYVAASLLWRAERVFLYTCAIEAFMKEWLKVLRTLGEDSWFGGRYVRSTINV